MTNAKNGANNGRRRATRDRRAVTIEEVAGLIGDAARVVAAHADEIAEWLARRAQSKREETNDG